MSDTIKPAAIRKTLAVRAAPETAFRVFTEGFGLWWPKEHSLADAPLVDAVIEPRVGGRWFSRHADGSEAPWGEVLVWEPPVRVVLAWRITHEFAYDPNLLTEVDVRFAPDGDGATVVTFEHRGLERFGESAAAKVTAGKMDEGWGEILESFRAVAERPGTV
jgi:uncharacterized protein YndB with AHSA1/START domain